MVPLSKQEKSRQSNKWKQRWKCPEGNCDPQAFFGTIKLRHQHLRDAHKWSEEAVMLQIPLTKRELKAQKKTAEGSRDNEEEVVEDE